MIPMPSCIASVGNWRKAGKSLPPLTLSKSSAMYYLRGGVAPEMFHKGLLLKLWGRLRAGFMACLACWWQAPFMETKQAQRLRPSLSESLASFATAYRPAYCLAPSHPLILNLPSSLLRVCCWSQGWSWVSTSGVGRKQSE